MIVLDSPGDPELTVLGAVRGLVKESESVLAHLERFRPGAVALGLPPSEAESLRTHFLGRPTEPVVPLSSTEVTEALALSRYGEVAVPNPSFLRLLDWGSARGVPVEGIDAEEEILAEMFIAHIGYFELVRRTLGERRVGRRPPEAPDADRFALAWDAAIRPGRGSERYEEARERAALEGLRALRGAHRRVAVVLDRERAERFRAMAASGPKR